MKLYEVPQRKGVKVRLLPDEQDTTLHPPAHRDFSDDEVITFSHIDGMYSLCWDASGKPVHLAAWAEVEIIND